MLTSSGSSHTRNSVLDKYARKKTTATSGLTGRGGLPATRFCAHRFVFPHIFTLSLLLSHTHTCRRSSSAVALNDSTTDSASGISSIHADSHSMTSSPGGLIGGSSSGGGAGAVTSGGIYLPDELDF